MDKIGPGGNEEMIKVNDKHVIKGVDYKKYEKSVREIHNMIHEKSGPGNDFLGWLNYPAMYDRVEFEAIKKYAKYVRDNFEVLVVCGIGGSYLGARAAIEALRGLHSQDKLEIIFLGQTFSSDYTYEVLDYIKDKKFAVNVISKSGTTTETSIAFRLLKSLLEKKLGVEGARKAIFATTDKEKGALKTLATNEGYPTFVLPGDIGGRYSVFTAVGLFPIACAGLNIDRLMEGALQAQKDTANPSLFDNEAYKYAVIRFDQKHQQKSVELFVTYEPKLVQLGEWFKQLYGESEGKDGKGLFPTSATFSTDLHSLGQFIQDGSKCLFETIVHFEKANHDVEIPSDKLDLDGLNYLAGKNLNYVNEQAFKGTLEAHEKSGQVPNVVLEVEKLDEYTLGYMFYFFMKACAMSAYLLKVNPFNQPGVEIYKKNMFHLLGKKGY